jgi:hypothetical protein
MSNPNYTGAGTLPGTELQVAPSSEPRHESDDILDLIGDLPPRKIKLPSPKKSGLNLKTTKTQATALFADLITPPPRNPIYIWQATLVIIPHVETLCTACNTVHHQPLPAMCEWNRPYQSQKITNRRFPVGWSTLPRERKEISRSVVNGCLACMEVHPTEFGDEPLVDDSALPRTPARLGVVPEAPMESGLGLDDPFPL